jgi:hypothetical protein
MRFLAVLLSATGLFVFTPVACALCAAGALSSFCPVCEGAFFHSPECLTDVSPFEP